MPFLHSIHPVSSQCSLLETYNDELIITIFYLTQRLSAYDDDDDYWKKTTRGMSFNDEDEEARQAAHDFASKNRDLFEDNNDDESIVTLAGNAEKIFPQIL